MNRVEPLFARHRAGPFRLPAGHSIITFDVRELRGHRICSSVTRMALWRHHVCLHHGPADPQDWAWRWSQTEWLLFHAIPIIFSSSACTSWISLHRIATDVHIHTWFNQSFSDLHAQSHTPVLVHVWARCLCTATLKMYDHALQRSV